KIEKDFATSHLVPTSIYQIAASYSKLGKYPEAKEKYDRLLKLYPENPLASDAQCAIGWTYFYQNKFEEAKTAFQKVISDYPQTEELTPLSYFWIGQCDYNEQKYEEALRTFQTLMEKYPENNLTPEALLKTGECYHKMEKEAESLAAFRRVVKDYPNFESADYAQYKIASYFWEREDYEKAVSEYEKLINDFPKSSYLPDAYYRQGWSFYKLGKFREAELAYSQFIKLLPLFPKEEARRGEVYYRLGESFFGQEKFGEAIDSYKRALQIAKEKSILHNSLYETALCWENLKDWERQGEALEEFITQFPASDLIPQAHLKLANSWLKRNKFAQARDHYTWVVKNSEEAGLKVEAQFRIGDCWFNEKNFERAIEEYLRVPILYSQYK
ncbi:MAG: tetratricopeptide repeat protein, partial [Candidatus Aminicenantes bacterium]|nr:tetratricopeptide repeat protein [Candidatus Aminicenantes bacterium]